MTWPEWTSPDGRIRLINADCLEVLPSLTGIDAVVTDPPYGVDFEGKNTKHTIRRDEGYESPDDPTIGPAVARECIRLFGRVIVMPGVANAFSYPKPDDIGSVFCPSGAGLGKWGFIGTHPILYYGKCPYLQRGMGHRPNSFQSFATAPPNGHPCPKPVAWMEWLVRKATVDLGEMVCDPMAGSMTTAIACIRTDRRCICIEKEETYWQIGIDRCQREYNRTVLFNEQEAVA